MEFKPFALVLASFFLLSFLQSPQPIHAEAKNFLSDFCGQSPHPRFCMRVFGADPRSPKAKDFKDIATVVLGTASDKARGFANYVRRLMKTNHAKALAVCAENYDAASGSFRSSLSELTEDPMTANYDAKVAGDGARVCSDAMAEAKLQIPTIATKNTKIQTYSDLAYTITDIIQRTQMNTEGIME